MSLLSCPTNLCLKHATRHVVTSGPLHLVFPLLQMFFFHIHKFSHSFQAFTKILPSKWDLQLLSKWKCQPSLTYAINPHSAFLFLSSISYYLKCQIFYFLISCLIIFIEKLIYSTMLVTGISSVHFSRSVMSNTLQPDKTSACKASLCDWGQEEKGTTEAEMVGWHHRLNGHEFG